MNHCSYVLSVRSQHYACDGTGWIWKTDSRFEVQQKLHMNSHSYPISVADFHRLLTKFAEQIECMRWCNVYFRRLLKKLARHDVNKRTCLCRLSRVGLECKETSPCRVSRYLAKLYASDDIDVSVNKDMMIVEQATRRNAIGFGQALTKLLCWGPIYDWYLLQETFCWRERIFDTTIRWESLG